ncbi:MAG: MarR family transcriptional regulator [Rhizobium sp.]|jgi:MarR family transcriptional regulator for hemolysin|nr:MarR family transcriptional regulator [Rhizobium sp.]
MTPEFLEPRTKASRKVRIAFNQQVAAHGLTYPRGRTLFSVAKKQNMYQIELACDLELEPATMVILDRIEENGLIERRPDARDRRVNLIVLTPIVEEQAALATSIGRTCA